ncbi:unnamed protein product [Moneuplotes crassus]|uniref:Protein kinase domain-containing protein n=1 Tax=Euplotes crassus TaxID=5936 RepID=A0AAD1Y562_EUPCR|nr:unnamed protein product [Moneuplotes crassus]
MPWLCFPSGKKKKSSDLIATTVRNSALKRMKSARKRAGVHTISSRVLLNNSHSTSESVQAMAAHNRGNSKLILQKLLSQDQKVKLKPSARRSTRKDLNNTFDHSKRGSFQEEYDLNSSLPSRVSFNQMFLNKESKSGITLAQRRTRIQDLNVNPKIRKSLERHEIKKWMTSMHRSFHQEGDKKEEDSLIRIMDNGQTFTDGQNFEYDDTPFLTIPGFALATNKPSSRNVIIEGSENGYSSPDSFTFRRTSGARNYLPVMKDQEIQCELLKPPVSELSSESASEYSFVEHKVTVNEHNSPKRKFEVNLSTRNVKMYKNQYSIPKRIDQEPSEVDLDGYLLGSENDREDLLSTSRNQEDGKSSSTPKVNKLGKTSPKRKTFLLQPKIVSDQLLDPMRLKSGTFDNRVKPKKIGTFKTNLGSSLKKSNYTIGDSSFEKTVTDGVSQLSIASKFISPVLKNKLKKKSANNNESEISENLPPSITQLSNEQHLMEEIKELQTRENFESNNTEFMKKRFSVPQKRQSFGRQISFKDKNKFIYKPNNFGIQKTKPRGLATVFGNLKRWSKGERLGCGAYGDVVKAIDRTDGSIFAVKKMLIQKNQNEFNKDAIEALKSEIKILKDYEHEFIIKYIGSEMIRSDTFYIYLEFATEGSLVDMYKEFGPFDENLVRKYCTEILQGLAFLHGKNIVHQDLKCANILIKNGHVKISDFGCAKIIQKSMTCTNLYNSLKGTIPWMAPEVVRQKMSDCKADVWSLGCTIIEMATCSNPWGEENIGNNIEDLYKLCDRFDHPPIPKFFSTNLKDFLEMCFVIEPKKRPSSAQLLTHDFLRGE